METQGAYPAAVGIAVASLTVILLVTPPMWWHIRSRNIGAASVIIWIIINNSMTFLNAILWPNDNFDGYLGQGLCDVEIKLQIASQVAFSASFACVLRALATVMDTKRMVVVQSKAQRRRNIAIDLSWCFGIPMLQMLFQYIVQGKRYYLFGISGCVPGVTNNWLTVVLIMVMPVVWVLVCATYATIILIRLYRYRRSFRTLLQNHDTSKSRFLRLFLLCIIWILGNVPVQCWVFSLSFSVPREPFDWNEIHDPEELSQIIAVPSLGMVLYDRYIWLASGILMFLFFGFGTEALQMYRAGWNAVGIAKLVPARFKGGNRSYTSENRELVMKRAVLKSVGDDSLFSMSTDVASTKDSDMKLAELDQGSTQNSV
ncbi:hypothetical protein AMS68_004248 [Peltaster fructicola]|uniref:Uncharacterized protein n=1 Tax=Peltaster fructicola TaxID=286661 RepID=A0A6H0XVP7_9PEZI|nr:hypothetical protein AMS68_004248 [Peltaster fructicola]